MQPGDSDAASSELADQSGGVSAPVSQWEGQLPASSHLIVAQLGSLPSSQSSGAWQSHTQLSEFVYTKHVLAPDCSKALQSAHAKSGCRALPPAAASFCWHLLLSAARAAQQRRQFFRPIPRCSFQRSCRPAPFPATAPAPHGWRRTRRCKCAAWRFCRHAGKGTGSLKCACVTHGVEMQGRTCRTEMPRMVA